MPAFWYPAAYLFDPGKWLWQREQLTASWRGECAERRLRGKTKEVGGRYDARLLKGHLSPASSKPHHTVVWLQPELKKVRAHLFFTLHPCRRALQPLLCSTPEQPWTRSSPSLLFSSFTTTFLVLPFVSTLLYLAQPTPLHYPPLLDSFSHSLLSAWNHERVLQHQVTHTLLLRPFS